MIWLIVALPFPFCLKLFCQLIAEGRPRLDVVRNLGDDRCPCCGGCWHAGGPASKTGHGSLAAQNTRNAACCREACRRDRAGQVAELVGARTSYCACPIKLTPANGFLCSRQASPYSAQPSTFPSSSYLMVDGHVGVPRRPVRSCTGSARPHCVGSLHRGRRTRVSHNSLGDARKDTLRNCAVAKLVLHFLALRLLGADEGAARVNKVGDGAK